MLFKKSDYKNATDNVEISLALHNKNSYAYKNRALYYLAVPDKEKARADLNRALESGFTEDCGEEVNNLLGEMDKI